MQKSVANQQGRTTGVGSVLCPARYQAAAEEAENTVGTKVFSNTGNILFSCPGAKLQLQRAPASAQDLFYERFYESTNRDG